MILSLRYNLLCFHTNIDILNYLNLYLYNEKLTIKKKPWKFNNQYKHAYVDNVNSDKIILWIKDVKHPLHIYKEGESIYKTNYRCHKWG